ncbi:MAG: ECF-type sigma factor [Aureliella sp.]
MTHSISELIQQVQDGQSFAAEQVWALFIDRLVSAARRHLRNMPRRVVDEEDVAVTAFEAFLRGAKERRFKKLESRDDLWAVLAMLTERTAISVLRRALTVKRGGGHVRGESVFEKMLGESSMAAGLHQIGDPDQQVVEMFTVEVRELLEQLDDELLQRIALLRLEGYTNSEIAKQLGFALRAVERKLHLIRLKWSE